MKAAPPPPSTVLGPDTLRAIPLQWWTGSQLDALAGHVKNIGAAWVHDWIGDAGADMAIADAMTAHTWPGHERAQWVSFGSRGQAAAWLDLRTDPMTPVLEAMFGAEASPFRHPWGRQGIAQALADRAWNALAQALRTALEIDAQASHDDSHQRLFRPWTGATVVSLSLGGKLAIAMLLNAACLRGILVEGERTIARALSPASRPPLVPLVHALSGRVLPLQVELASCELDLGSLESLCIGDVVPLPHHLDAPLFISAEPGFPVCAGFLGRQSGFKAIELARVAADDREAQVGHHPERL